MIGLMKVSESGEEQKKLEKEKFEWQKEMEERRLRLEEKREESVATLQKLSIELQREQMKTNQQMMEMLLALAKK